MEIWIAGFVVLLSMASVRTLGAGAVILGVFWSARVLLTGRLTLRTPSDFGVLVLLMTIPLSLWATAFPEETKPQLLRLILGILFYYAIVNWAQSEKRLKLVVTSLIAGGTGLLGFALVSVKWVTHKLPFLPPALYDKFGLLVTDTIHPNVLAGTLVLIVPVAFALLFFSPKRIHWVIKLLAGIMAAGSLGTLLLTQSRGAMIALAAALGVLVCLRWRLGWIIIPLGAIFMGVVIYQAGVGRMLDFVSANQTLNGLDGRIEIWSRALAMIRDFPFTGIGMGSFGKVADLLYPYYSALPGTVEHAHNLFLQVAVDLGLPGLIAWLSILLGAIGNAWRLFRLGKAAGNGFQAALGAGLLSSQAALVIHGTMDAVTWGMVKPAPLVWALWGIAAASVLNLGRMEKEKGSSGIGR